jgi:hypothetical protein
MLSEVIAVTLLRANVSCFASGVRIGFTFGFDAEAAVWVNCIVEYSNAAYILATMID